VAVAAAALSVFAQSLGLHGLAGGTAQRPGAAALDAAHLEQQQQQQLLVLVLVLPRHRQGRLAACWQDPLLQAVYHRALRAAQVHQQGLGLSKLAGRQQGTAAVAQTSTCCW
jgi:hypothetical protein